MISISTSFQIISRTLHFCTPPHKNCVLQDKVAKAQEVKTMAMTSMAQAIEDEKKEQWRAEGRSMLFDAKRVSSWHCFTFISQHLFCSLYCYILTQ